MSTFGSLYRVTTYGESHCASVGCIIDGVPPVRTATPIHRVLGLTLTLVLRLKGMELTPEDIQIQLSRRRPGQSDLTTPVRPIQTLTHQNQSALMFSS